MGNHGPAYYKRYPKEFEIFTPVCKTNQLEECTKEEISNAYDNAILYTDYFLSKVIIFLKSYSKNYETAMIYMSDHGESLGENGIYLHGLPYFMAPDAQTHIGALMCFGGIVDFQGYNKECTPNQRDALCLCGAGGKIVEPFLEGFGEFVSNGKVYRGVGLICRV